MPELTVGVNTFRPGGIDVLFNSLAQQDFRDYELVLVDELYNWREREVAEYAEKLGIPLVHVPPKKRQGNYKVGISNGVNTFLVFAQSDLVLFLTDYEWVGQDVLKRHVELQRKRKRAVITGLVHRCAHPKLGDLKGKITVFAEEVKSRPKKVVKWCDKAPRLVGVGEHRTGYVGDNTSFPLGDALEINGFDERYDLGGHGFEDTDFFARLRFMGHRFYCDTHSEVYELQHGFFPVHEEHPNPNAKLYSERVARMENGVEPLQAPNPFNAYRVRDEILRIRLGVKMIPIAERHPAQVLRFKWLFDNLKGKVLDVGCIRGTFPGAVNLDIVPRDAPNFVLGDAHELPFEDGSFDTVVMAELPEHLEDPQRAIKEALRVSREQVLITCPDEFNWAARYRPFASPPLFKGTGPAAHRRYYTRQLLEYELRQAGARKFAYKHLECGGMAFHLVKIGEVT